MAKRNPYLDKMGIERKVIDEEAFSVTELMPLLGVNWTTASLYAKKRVSEGSWQSVWKKDRIGRPIRAYRPAKV